MAGSFTSSHPAPSASPDRVLRREAQGMLVAAGSRLIDVLRRVAGSDGFALGHAFRDIVMDGGMSPSAWPVAEVVEILASADAGSDPRIAPLMARLRGLLLRINALDDGFGELADGSAADPVRDAA